MSVFKYFFCGAVGLLALVATGSSAKTTGLVTLSTMTGDITFTGTFVSLKDEKFTIRTPDLGTIRVSADNFTCTGIACPGVASELAIRDMGKVAPGLVAGLLEGYAASIGADYSQDVQASSKSITVSKPDGSLHLEVKLHDGVGGSAGSGGNVSELGVAAWRLQTGVANQ
ncbi:MAG: hypothetical protein AAFQ66_03980 [Pseudomonadota bacterium]